MRQKFYIATLLFALAFEAGPLQAETTRNRRSLRSGGDVIRNCQQGRGLATQNSRCRAELQSSGDVLGNANCGGQHKGCDYSRSNKSGAAPPVYALHGGKVIFAGFRSDYGNRIVVKNSDGSFTTYSHLSSFSVRKGASVSVGTKLGIMGATGSATGIHLHIEEIDSSGRFKNPGSAYGRNFC